MTAKIFSKDLRLAAHPMMYVFALFGAMLIIPNYPYTVVFFYGLLGIFFTFLNGRENKDVYYCAVLPVTKRDQVRARAWLVVAVELTEDNKRQFFIPRGFAHGFAVLSDEATFQYKCDNPYAPESEGAIAWDDPTLGIDWRLAPEDVVLSPKDSAHPLLSEAGELFDYNEDYYA